jgi:hypothetical protein
METLAWLEGTAFSTWVRESPPVYPTILVMHALGMGFLAGINVLIGLRLAGVATQVPVARLARFLPLMWIAFAASAISGTLLLLAYPAKALTNPVFGLKLILIAAAFALLRSLRHRALADEGEVGTQYATSGVALLLIWAGVITAGRLLAYTHSVLLASHEF